MLALIERISITNDPGMDAMGYPEGNPIEIELTDGAVLSAWGKGRGGLENPVPREEVIEKFCKVTRRQLKPGAQEAVIEQCMRLDKMEDATKLIQALRP